MKLTPDLQEQILAKLAAGWSYGTCAKWCERQGVSITREAIGKFARQSRTLRADASKNAVRSVVAQALETALTQYADDAAMLRRVLVAQGELALEDPRARKAYVELFGEYRNSVAALVKWSGAEEPDTDLVTGIADLLGLAFNDDDEADALGELEGEGDAVSDTEPPETTNGE